MRNLNNESKKLIENQLLKWSLARENYNRLANIKSREILFNNDVKIIIQYNPGRVKSSTARVDPGWIKGRACFLCLPNLPEEQIKHGLYKGYQLLVNPYPVFGEHFTIRSTQHVDQRFISRFKTMLKMVKQLNNYLLLYNGPGCGASAPDHFHFQAGSPGLLPIESEFDHIVKRLLYSDNNCKLYSLDNYLRKTLVLEGNDMDGLKRIFDTTCKALSSHVPSEPEPMMNIISYFINNNWRIFIFPRRAHRPSQYALAGPEQLLLSPAAVEFGGVFITHREEDFYKLNETLVENIFSQLTLCNESWEQLKEELDNTRS